MRDSLGKLSQHAALGVGRGEVELHGVQKAEDGLHLDGLHPDKWGMLPSTMPIQSAYPNVLGDELLMISSSGEEDPLTEAQPLMPACPGQGGSQASLSHVKQLSHTQRKHRFLCAQVGLGMLLACKKCAR